MAGHEVDGVMHSQVAVSCARLGQKLLFQKFSVLENTALPAEKTRDMARG